MSFRVSFLVRAALAGLALAVAPLSAATLRSGVGLADMDTTVAPCDDFYRYANGHWQDVTVIPPGYAAIGTGREMFDRNQEALKRVLDRSAANVATEKDATVRKLGAFYAVLMDSARSEKEGGTPLASRLARIDAVRSKADLVREFARLRLDGLPQPIVFNPEADPKQSSMNIGQIWQGGFGLPERDFYFRTDPKSDSVRTTYVGVIANLLALSGVPADRAKTEAQEVMKLETALAESSITRTQMRDPKAIYHKMSVRELTALAPAIDWPAFFNAVGVPSLAKPDAKLDVSIPSFVRGLNAQVANTSLDTWRAYLRACVLRGSANWLSEPYLREALVLQDALTGTGVALARWKRASAVVDATMGEALGKAYVATEFPPDSKARMMEMVNNLQAAFRERIRSRTWMSEATKKQAIGKLDAVLKKIGYPDTWRDYSRLEIDPALSGYENLRRAQTFEVRRQLAQIGKPVDRTEWGMSPPTVNAYYNPNINEIVFPAGILQPPRFDPRVDDAFNYGAAGMVIGHELTHGFDDEGRQYDAQGNLRDWWTAEDAKHFQTEADKVVNQYGSYVGVDTLHLNGRMTLGENIADIGGLTIAFHAWKRSLNGKPSEVIDGFTGEQRFFLGHAQAWRSKMRDAMLRTVVLSNEHSPNFWRVNGPLSVMPEFAEAFGCKSGSKMVRGDAERAAIW